MVYNRADKHRGGWLIEQLLLMEGDMSLQVAHNPCPAVQVVQG